MKDDFKDIISFSEQSLKDVWDNKDDDVCLVIKVSQPKCTNDTPGLFTSTQTIDFELEEPDTSKSGCDGGNRL